MTTPSSSERCSEQSLQRSGRAGNARRALRRASKSLSRRDGAKRPSPQQDGVHWQWALTAGPRSPQPGASCALAAQELVIAVWMKVMEQTASLWLLADTAQTCRAGRDLFPMSLNSTTLSAHPPLLASSRSCHICFSIALLTDHSHAARAGALTVPTAWVEVAACAVLLSNSPAFLALSSRSRSLTDEYPKSSAASCTRASLELGLCSI